MNKLSVCFFIVVLMYAKSYALTDYNVYHKYIAKAEQFCFIENNTDSSLFYFSKAFNSYDFVFVKDCIEAIQIAVIFKKDSLLMPYFKKAFENGFKISNLYNLATHDGRTGFFDYVRKKPDFYLKLDKIYPEARNVFLKRINIDVLNLITKRFAYDQSNKNSSNDSLKNDIFRKNFLLIDSLIGINLFPSEQVVGVTQHGIFKEAGKTYKELIDWYDILKSTVSKINHFSESQFTIEEYALTSNMVFVLLYHYDSSYIFLEKNISKLISSGAMHPRELATLHDEYVIKYRIRKGKKVNISFIPEKSVGPHILFFDNTQENRDKVNRKRAAYGIVPVEVDSAKHLFEEKYKASFYTKYLMHR